MRHAWIAEPDKKDEACEKDTRMQIKLKKVAKQSSQLKKNSYNQRGGNTICPWRTDFPDGVVRGLQGEIAILNESD